MSRKLPTRQTSFVALLVLSMLGLGAQTFETLEDAGCRCAANSVVSLGESNGNGAESFRSETTDDSNCCSLKTEAVSSCCCNPNAAVCHCGDCRCGGEKLPSQPLPAIPTSETNEVVPPTLICAAPHLGFPRPCELKQLRWPRTFTAHAVLSSKQTCVLLSRFTC